MKVQRLRSGDESCKIIVEERKMNENSECVQTRLYVFGWRSKTVQTDK